MTREVRRHSDADEGVRATQVSPMLAKVKINGSEKQIVVGSGKLGIVYAFDQDSGKTLWSTPVGLHQNDTLSALPLDQSLTWVAPGAWGGGR